MLVRARATVGVCMYGCNICISDPIGMEQSEKELFKRTRYICPLICIVRRRPNNSNISLGRKGEPYDKNDQQNFCLVHSILSDTRVHAMNAEVCDNDFWVRHTCTLHRYALHMRRFLWSLVAHMCHWHTHTLENTIVRQQMTLWNSKKQRKKDHSFESIPPVHFCVRYCYGMHDNNK